MLPLSSSQKHPYYCDVVRHAVMQSEALETNGAMLLRFSASKIVGYINLFLLLLLFVVYGFELRTLYLVVRCSTT
jgi:hypothetical protein